MELAFPWPISQGEWLAWLSATITALWGLVLLLAPRIAARILRLQAAPDHPDAIGELRSSLGGFHLGIGLSAILFAQPLIYLALGMCWALAAFGRFIAMLSDDGNSFYNWVRLVIEGILGLLALGYALGLIA